MTFDSEFKYITYGGATGTKFFNRRHRLDQTTASGSRNRSHFSSIDYGKKGLSMTEEVRTTRNSMRQSEVSKILTEYLSKKGLFEANP